MPVALPICGEPETSAEVLAFLRCRVNAEELAAVLVPVTFLMSVIMPVCGVDVAVEVAMKVLVSVQVRVVLEESVIMPPELQSPLKLGVKLLVATPVSESQYTPRGSIV